MSDQEIEKAESTSKTVTRPLQTEKGQPRIITSGKYIQDQRNKDLGFPQRLCTFDNMVSDDAVYNSIDVTNLLVLIALQGGEYVSPNASSEGKAAADFLNYNIRNMSYGTWMEFIQNANTDLQNGFSIQNLVVERKGVGPYAKDLTLKRLAPRDQKSVYGWVWDKNLRDLKGFVQKPMLRKLREPNLQEIENGITLNDISNGLYKAKYPFIASQQMIHFRHNPTNNNPQGHSPLLACYDAWMEKKLIERYECVGVSKDLGGAIVLRVPSELIAKANDPANYPAEAQEYADLQRDAGALHAGESSYIVLSSDVDAATKVKNFDFELKGIDGGGKQYKTSEIIDQKRKSIYNVFGAGFLLLGQDGTGSNALSTNQQSTHDLYVERNILWKCDVLNNQLAPRLLAVNNVYLDYKDMPVFKPADPTKPDFETLSKAIQRMKSTGAMTPSALEHVYQTLGLPTEGIEDLIFDDGDTSRGGESGGTSGVGGTQSGGASSEENLENSMQPKQIVTDGVTDRLIDTATDKCINEDELDKDGNYKI